VQKYKENGKNYKMVALMFSNLHACAQYHSMSTFLLVQFEESLREMERSSHASSHLQLHISQSEQGQQLQQPQQSQPCHEGENEGLQQDVKSNGFFGESNQRKSWQQRCVLFGR